MFIIWGSRSILITIGVGTFMCPRCRTEKRFSHKLYKRFFTLYYIPLIPIGDGPSFVECKHCHGKFNPEVTTLSVMQAKYQRRYPLLTAYGLILAVFVGILLIGSFQNAQAQRQAQQLTIAISNTKIALTNNYGVANLDRCKSVSVVAHWPGPTSAHFLFVNAGSQEVASDYQDQLPAENRALSQQDLTHVVCLHSDAQEFDHDDYGDGKSSATIYTCTRYIRYVEAYVVDVKTGETIAYHKFPGSLPAQCPDQTDDDIRLYGDDPTPAEIVAGLQSYSGQIS